VHSLGWEFEETERKVELVAHSDALRKGACDLAVRAVEMAKVLLERDMTHASIERADARRPPDFDKGTSAYCWDVLSGRSNTMTSASRP
jgi:hypothetical protein